MTEVILTPGHIDIADGIIEGAKKEGRKILMEHESKSILEAYGVSCSKTILAKDNEEALRAAKEVGYPLVMKVASPDIVHKTDAGCVRLGISSDVEVQQAFTDIIKNAKAFKADVDLRGVVVQEQAKKGTEVIVGLLKDKTFGPTLMFGLGGIFVEVLKDVSFRVVPLNQNDAESMIREIKGYRVLKGVRGAPPSDEGAIVNILLSCSKLAHDFESKIDEMDVNPLLIYPDGAKAVDARIVLA
ncbi:MAG: acetate--CoA ligase family protein [Nitrosopumilus sp.]